MAAGFARKHMGDLIRLTILLSLAGWLLLSWPFVHGALWRNLGFLALNQTRATGTGNAALDARAHSRLSRATALDPQAASAWRALGYLYLAQGQGQPAAAAWRQSPGMVAELVATGQAAEAAGDQEEALRWYGRAVEVAPHDPIGWLMTGAIYDLRGDWPGAVAVYRAGIDALSAASTASSDLYYRLARAMLLNPEKSADYAAIFDVNERALRLDRFESDLGRLHSRFIRAVALRGLGREAEALTEFEWVIEREPDNYWALVNLGELTWQLRQDTAAAEARLRAALAIDGNNKVAYLALGQLYWDTGRRDEARDLYRAVLRLDAGDPTAAARLEGE